MTASVQPESKSTSRRALLIGAVGGIGALAATVIGRVDPVRAQGQPVLVGGDYPDATSVTKISNLTTSSYVLWGASSNGVGVAGTTGSSYGVFGDSISSVGVYGNSDSSVGVQATSTASSVAASLGRSYGNSTGVQGYSGGGLMPAAKPKTGVFGSAAQDSASRGVIGESPAGIGVLGQSDGTGVGVRAYNTNNSGLALRVTGKAAFDRSGELTVVGGQASVTKTGIALSSASFVLATLQTNVAGLFVQAVVLNAAGSSFTIYLNKAPAGNVVVAWMAVN